MSIIVVGCGSGLGREIFNYLKKDKKKVFGFSSKKSKKFEYLNLNNFNSYDFRKKINKIDRVEEVYYLSNYSENIFFTKIDDKKLDTFVNFNILNFMKVMKILIKKNNQIKINIILSHICFMYNYGFSIYKAQKLFQKNILQSIKIENPNIKINYIYPGAMKTNFVKNNKYKGKSIFKQKNPKFVARKIIKNKKKFYSKFDILLYLIEKLLPEKLHNFLFRKILEKLYNR